MGTNELEIYCSNCRKKATWHVDPVNHRNQFLMTLFTLGLWLPIWLALAFIKVKSCDICDKAIYED